MVLSRWCRGIAALLLVAVCSHGEKALGGDRYFPETGKGAIHQRALEVGGGAVVLQIALQPGYEDLPLLAHLRMERGARAVVAYVTNGDATPGDDGGSAPIFVAAQRREEAYNATEVLGVTAHFLNLPDPGVVGSRNELGLIWNLDTARARLQQALRHYRPDAVVVGGDFRGDTIQSLRQRLLTDLVLEAVRSVSRDTVVSDTVKLAGWDVQRVYEESARGGGGRTREYDRAHRFWRKSYREIAEVAGGEYRTLRLQRASWAGEGDRRYRLIHNRGAANPRSMLDGLPVVTRRLGPLAARIRRAVLRESGGLRSPLLREVSRAVDSVDVYLARGRASIPPREIRLLAGWKNGLEDLRCSLLGVAVDFVCSDSLTTPLQLVFLKFRGFSARTSGGRNRILFPGAIKHIWGINESPEHQFNFEPPQEFRIITPQNMEMTVPGSQFGITQSALRTRFSFLVMHFDTLREKNFFYRGEVRFRVGPRRTFEVLTPVVRAMDDEPVVYRLINISRDNYQGTISIVDSAAERATRSVSLPVKDCLLVDTLRLRLRSPLARGDHPMKISLSGGSAEQFVVRSFEARADSGARIGLVSGLDEDPVAAGMDRLRLSWRRLDRGGKLAPQLASLNVLVLSRGAGVFGRAMDAAPIREWVRGGGHLVILPQAGVPGIEASFVPGLAFQNSPQLPPETALKTDTTQPVLLSPNRISGADWDEWVVARSFGSIAIGGPARVVVSAGNERSPLVVEVDEGKGRITVVALDLVSQLLNVHPGAHRVLANILRP